MTYGSHTLYGMWECYFCQRLLWSPKPYVECRNLVTVNDLWFPNHYMECGDLLSVNDCFVSLTLYGKQEPCICQ